jgi:hypothetical protein
MKNTLICMVFTVAMGTPAFSMDYKDFSEASTDEKHSIFVSFSPADVDVKEENGLLSVSPKTDQLVINYKAYSDSGSHILNITSSAEDIISPFREDVSKSQLLPLFAENPTKAHVCTDFFQDDFVTTDSSHYIRNGGFYHAGNKQEYVRSTLEFEAGGGVTLNPSSKATQQLDQMGAQSDDPLAKLFAVGLKLYTAHLSQDKIKTVHEFPVKSTNSISSIIARPFGAIKREASIHGTISYGDSFAMNLSLQGAVLEFQPNNGFQFELLG